MKLLPHKTIPTSQVPLLRKLEAYEDPYDLESKAAKLVGLLWEKMPKSDPIETCFRLERLLMYHAKGAERSFSVPFLHHFYLPTKEGLSWMQNRFEKKYGMHVELIKSSSHFEAYQKAFLKEKGSCFYPLILEDESPMVMHVTPCFFLKNTHGAIFVHLDSMGSESTFLKLFAIGSKLDKSITCFINEEMRQKDGFSCRVDAFVILKQFFKAFQMNPEMRPEEFIASSSSSTRLEGAYEINLKGAFLKSAQVVIQDGREKESLLNRGRTLEDIQRLYTVSYHRHIYSGESPKEDRVSSCVFLQAKMLKYILEFQKEIDDNAERYNSFKLTFDDDF